MQGVPLVVLANKQDLINALRAAEVGSSTAVNQHAMLAALMHTQLSSVCTKKSAGPPMVAAHLSFQPMASRKDVLCSMARRMHEACARSCIHGQQSLQPLKALSTVHLQNCNSFWLSCADC